MADMAPESADRGQEGSAPNAKAVDRATAYWREIARYDRVTSSWHETGKRITKKYRDQDRAQAGHEKTSTSRRFALLWSNVETLKPAVYAKLPTAVVSRRFRDSDPIGRIGAELLERASNSSADLYNYDETFRMVRDDRLLPARGQAWVRYEADFEDVEETGEDGKPVMDDNGEPKTYSRLIAVDDGEYDSSAKAEKVCVDHVHWCDFGHNVARVWADVWLVWRKVHKTRSEVRSRFDNKIAEALTYDVRSPEDGEKEESGELKTCLYETWDKRRRRVCFLSKGYEGLIEDDKPPLKLHGFFPCPEPAYGTKTSDSLVPRPDFCFYQDQAEEIDALTEKIAELSDWLIVKGFIPGGPSSEGADAIERLLREKGKSILVPIESWAGFTEKGGSRQIDWLPLDVIILALKSAIEARQQLVQDVYQVTGVSDILRGETDPNETLGAQQLKAQTGSRRVRNTRDELARFSRDIYRLVCEVIAENFNAGTLAAMTGYKYVPGRVIGVKPEPAMLGAPPGMMPRPPMNGNGMAPPGLPAPPGQSPVPPGMPPQGMPPMSPGQPVPGSQGAPMLPPSSTNDDEASAMIFDDQVIERLRNDRVRSYSIDVETDSTIQPDEDAEKQRRVEFATMFGGMLKSVVELTAAGPIVSPLAPMIGEGLKFVTRGFRAGRAMEESIEKAVEGMLAKIKAIESQPPQPSPEEMKLHQDAKAQAAELQFKERDSQLTNQLEVQKAQLTAQIETMKAQNQAALQERESTFKMQLQERELAHKTRMDEFNAQREMERSEFERQNVERDAQFREREINHKQRMDEVGAQRESEKATFDRGMATQQAERDAQFKERDFGHKQQMDIRSQEFEREKADKQIAFQREQADREIIAQGQSPNAAGKPDGIAALLQSVTATAEETKQALAQMAALQTQIAEFVEMSRKPKRLIKGVDGRATHVETGFGVREIERDPVSGGVVGLM